MLGSRLICISELIPFLLPFTCFLQSHAISRHQSHTVCGKKKFYFKDEMESLVPVPAGSDFPIQNLPYGVFTTPSQVILFIFDIAQKVSNGKKINSLRSILVSLSEITFWIWPLSLICIRLSCKMHCVHLC